MIKEKATVMIIGDTPKDFKILANMINQNAYKVYAFSCEEIGLEATQTINPNIVLLDINSHENNCYEVCRKIKEEVSLSKIPIIFLSVFNEIFNKVKAFKVGAADYICKPFHIEEVLARIESHLKIERMQIKLENYNNHLENLIKTQVREIADSQMTTIFALAKLAESRDEETGKHIERVQIYCKLLAEYLKNNSKDKNNKINDKFVNNIFHASPLHDIGKVGINDTILLKKDKLNYYEFNEMKKHTILGSQTLDAVKKHYPNNKFINMGVDIARYHHERWDGNGYPDGLKNKEIPLCARIMALADVYDALRSKRCYKSEFCHENTKKIILKESGKHFDPEIVDAFIALEDIFIDTYNKYSGAGLYNDEILNNCKIVDF